MELDDLKSAWNKYSQENEKILQVPEKELRKMLERRTYTITNKISRNIRIGFWIIIAWVCIGVGSDFVFSPMIENTAAMPQLSDSFRLSIVLIDILNYLLIFSAIIIFWVRYSKIESIETDQTDLAGMLKKNIGIVSSYRKMFYVVLLVVLVYVIASFSTGFVMGYRHQITDLGIKLTEMSTMDWVIVVLSFTFVLAVLLGVYFLLFNLFYKRLYGRHLSNLKQTLKELEEIPSEIAI